MSQLRPVLPLPPENYDPAYERRRNQRIEEILKTKLDRLAPGVFGGVPLGILSGADASFLVPKNVEVPVLWDVILVENTDLMDDGLPRRFTFNYEMVIQTTISLFVTTDHTNKFNRFEFIFKDQDSIEQYRTTVVQEVPANTYLNVTVTRPITNLSLDYLELFLQHDATVDVVIDMTKSTWTLMQLTVNPAYIESERYATTKAYNSQQAQVTSLITRTPGAKNFERFSLTKDYVK